jgi:putative ABC transport system substrate-binding protein
VNSRRRALAALVTSLALHPKAALAQRKPARLGWLSYVSPPDVGLAMLTDGLRELGHAEGSSYVVLPRYANGDFKRLPSLVEDLVAERVDVLVSRGPSTEFAKAARNRVAVVFAFSGDPVVAGFADSLSKPGRNMTGITFMATELCAKRVEFLKELLPNAKNIALLSNPEHAGELLEYRVTEETAQRLGMTVVRHLVQTPPELTPALDRIRASNADATLVFPDSLTLNHRWQIAKHAAQLKMPCVYGWTEFVEAGGLVSYGPGLIENFKRLSVFVDRILKGASASAIPIEQPQKISLTLNAGAAKALGMKLPPALLARADRIID